jgi:NAD(P)H-dependent FMN reductase
VTRRLSRRNIQFASAPVLNFCLGIGENSVDLNCGLRIGDGGVQTEDRSHVNSHANSDRAATLYSDYSGNFPAGETERKRTGVETELIDVCTLPMRLDDAGEQMKDAKFSATINRCDGLIIVTPEYNHGYPGILKHALDMNLEEYIHKAVGICGVSAGPFGGVRVIEALLPVMRELGLVTIFWDVNFGNVEKLFDDQGNLLDQSYVRRLDKFLNELIWMARLLRYGRENIPEVKA